MKGKIQTVLGPVDPDSLGLTLTHEHLLHDLEKRVFKCPIPQILQEKDCIPICMENLGIIRQYPYCFDDNIEFGDESVRQAVLEEMHYFKEHGGGTIVDNCSIGLRSSKQVQHMVQLSKETGVNIVAGTGFYVDCSQTPSTLKMKVEDMCELMRQDLLTGMGGTDVKCGVIGEVGCSWPMTDFEKKSLVATAIIEQEIKAPVIIHPGRDRKSPEEIFRVYQEAGGDVRHVVMSHLDRTALTNEDLLEFASCGSYCEYDLFGIEVSYYQPNTKIAMPSDAQRIEFLKYLFQEGYGDRIVIAHDIHTKHRLMKFGGHGFSHILINIVPQMKAKGFSEEDIKKILFTNPKNWLTYQ